jgi:hypothetical protein
MVLSDLKENRSDRSERKNRSQRKSLCSLRLKKYFRVFHQNSNLLHHLIQEQCIHQS